MTQSVEGGVTTRSVGTRMRRRLSIAVACCVALSTPLAVRADIFELKDGGEVVGSPVDRTKADDYVVRTADGSEVTVAKSALQRIVKQDEAAAEYRSKSRATPDTVEAHRELAAWCRARKMIHEADHHLARVAELDPNDEVARRSLGYQRVGNRWLTSDEVMKARGLVFFDGKYRTSQDVAIRERDKAASSTNIDWFQQLKLWRTWLGGRRADRAAQAQANILAINDPQAAPALIRVMSDEPEGDVFEMFLRVLSQLDHPAALQTLVACSLDPTVHPEIRAQCRDFLVRMPRPVPIVPFVQALKSKDNKVVNLAGLALGQLGNPAAVSPLIDALVTTHKYSLQPEGSGGDQITAGFGSPGAGGGGGLSMGGNGPKIETRVESNEKVHQALMKLSGKQNFEYDEQAWRAWYVDTQMRQHVNSRRDQ